MATSAAYIHALAKEQRPRAGARARAHHTVYERTLATSRLSAVVASSSSTALLYDFASSLMRCTVCSFSRECFCTPHAVASAPLRAATGDERNQQGGGEMRVRLCLSVCQRGSEGDASNDSILRPSVQPFL